MISQNYEGLPAVSRNVLYVITGALAVVVAVLGYRYYEDQQKTGIEITAGPNTLSIQRK